MRHYYNNINCTGPHVASERILGFSKRFGHLSLSLACHAAFPVVLNPDLLYCIWINFLPQAPWISVSDILLSNLCREIGYELYEMDMTVRIMLLKWLKKNVHFGSKRVSELASFLLQYSDQQLLVDDNDERSLAYMQRWTSLAILDQRKAASELLKQMSKFFGDVLNSDSYEVSAKAIRLSGLAKSLAEPLREYQTLFFYADGIERWIRGDRSSANLQFELSLKHQHSALAGIHLAMPKRRRFISMGSSSTSFGGYIKHIDPELAEIITHEEQRQIDKLELIASENYVSDAVREAMGSVLTNKYAEGYPGLRYQRGCEYVDIAEKLAQERAKELFKAEHVNVQPHSGTQAAMAVLFSTLAPGDIILGLDLRQGGHLTHGSPVSFSGRLYHVISYGVRRDTEEIDYDQVRQLALMYKPKLIIAGGSGYPRGIDFSKFREICNEVDAFFLATIAHLAGIICAGFHPNPVEYADFVSSTSHKTLRGPRGGFILCRSKYAKSIDYSVFPGIQGGPLMHMIAAKAVCFKEALQPAFKQYQARVLANSRQLCLEFMRLGYRLVTGGTDTHMILLDLVTQGITGKVAEETLDKVGITVNKNSIPFDLQRPQITSGIRIGTAAITTRGMDKEHMRVIASFIHRAFKSIGKEDNLTSLRMEVAEFCSSFRLFT